MYPETCGILMGKRNQIIKEKENETKSSRRTKMRPNLQGERK
jgi:hypothetical protein